MCRCLMQPVEEKKEKEERKEVKSVKKVSLKEDVKTVKRDEVETEKSVDKEEMKTVKQVQPVQQNKQSDTPFPRCKHCGGWGKDLVRSSGFCLHCERLLHQSKSTSTQQARQAHPTQSTQQIRQAHPTQSTQQVLLLFILS